MSQSGGQLGSEYLLKLFVKNIWLIPSVFCLMDFVFLMCYNYF